MKNIKKISIIIIILSFVFFNNIYASTNTETRTEDDLKIWDSYTVTSSLKYAALKTPKVDESEKIYDFADLLSDDEEVLLLADIQDYIEEYDMDMVVVTINNNNKSSATAYADDFYDYNYFGIGDTRDGSLLLIDMDNRDVWISTTGKAILVYDDARIDKMLDYIAPNLTSRNYKGAVDNYIKYASNYASLGIPSSNKDYYINENGEYVKNLKKSNEIMQDIISSVMFSIIPTIIFILIGIYGHKNVKKASKANYYLKNDSVKLTDNRDVFLHSNTTKVRIESSSGGYSGGSSTHHSSSGSSHGGGGRHF